MAAEFLLKKKYVIIQRNWRPSGAKQGLELDIVARLNDTLIFIEVKTRNMAGSQSIPPLAGFGLAKQKKMVQAAQEYLAAHNAWELPCRFDFIGICQFADKSVQINHLENVLEMTPSSARAHNWQPW